MTTHTALRPTRSRRSTGWVPFALLPLVVVPGIAGSLGLIELAGGPAIIPVDPRMSASPAPVIVHTVSALLYAVLGAFQFSTALRRRNPTWHRLAGRVLVVLGFAVVGSALWMTLFLPRQPGTGALAFGFRLAFGTGMAAALVLGVQWIRRGDVARHRAWMMRAYALALGAGTQGVAHAAFGTAVLTTDLALGAGRVVDLAIAEYLIRRSAGRRAVRRTSSSPVLNGCSA